MKGFTGLLSTLDEDYRALSLPPVVRGPWFAAELSPDVAAEVWAAAQAATPHGTEPKPLPAEPNPSLAHYQQLNFEQLKRAVNIEALTSFWLACEFAENHWLYGSDKSKWPAATTYEQARTAVLASLARDGIDF